MNMVTYPKDLYEIIVVNNDREDKTTEEVIKRKKRVMKNLKYLIEPNIGASFARNKGVEVAKYNHLIFIDDDVHVTPNFLTGHNDAWRKYPDAKMLGGRITAVLSNRKPMSSGQKAMTKKYGWCFAHLDLSDTDTPLTLGWSIFSANMSYRLEKDERQLFSLHFGIQFKANDQIGAEDYELVTRTLLNDNKVIFVASRSIQVEHLVSEERFTDDYIAYRHLKAGIEVYRMEFSLRKKFPQFKSFYIGNLRYFVVLKQLFFDRNEQIHLLSYLFNGRYFVN